VSNQLEQIVRPSQAPSIRPGPAVQIYATPKIIENEPIVWGTPGNSVFQLRASANDEAKAATWPETDRTYDVVRVYNKDDREQYIDTEVMTEYQGRNKITQDRIQIRFAATKESKDVEVRERGLKRKTSS